MIYKVKKLGYLSWIVIKDDEDTYDEYFVNFNIHNNKFVCSCATGYMLHRECKHIRMVKQFITKGIDTFDMYI